MNEGDVILTVLPQADGAVKTRPALLLRGLPQYGDFLACGISTQIDKAIPEFDEVVSQTDSDFAAPGLLADSVIRLDFLAVLPRRGVLGSIGAIHPERHARLLENLSKHLVENLAKSPDKIPGTPPDGHR